MPASTFVEALGAQRAHPRAARRLGERVGRRAADGELADLVGDRHDLVEADAALVARAAAAGAADRLVRRDHRRRRRRSRWRAPRRPASTTSCLQSHRRRARRCASTQLTALETRNGSTPISMRRAIAPGASFVCSVERTRWPVSAASTAICAVSLSRISPTMMMSGSARIIERRPLANVEARLRVDLHLLDARELVLDRVLDRDDVLLGRVELGQRAVERRRLARAGRAGDEHRAVGAGEGLDEAARAPGRPCRGGRARRPRRPCRGRA